MNAEFVTVVSFLSHQKLGLDGSRGFSFALGNAYTESRELGLQFFECKGALSGSVYVLGKGSDGLRGNDLRRGISAVNGEPEGNDPGSVEFMS